MVSMEVSNILCLSRDNTEQWCVYAHHWCGLPVFVTKDDRESRSALYRDGTSFIILGSTLIKSRNPKFIYNRLWHEVAHLYFKDVWKPWDISFEYRADLVAAAATGRDVSLTRLYQVRSAAATQDSVQAIEKRIAHLRAAANSYTRDDALTMLQSLRPVTIQSSVRGNQYI
ncbi:hypothetical protein SAMN02745823_01590 [Sporobacter termitidis DSM 10068]|uniref:Uncharacterized protein n=1 Tax=Sporobacter termitidis DSM 10068 TaxID=1123282 RepID=A0A1M5X465_9FIRM|nr:hypothetical protein [Sporobacter termitidis]SHH94599.1 hypothetical protein SAMN02745823_01590 [Sporobacter termitidis DSM 10068]